LPTKRIFKPILYWFLIFESIHPKPKGAAMLTTNRVTWIAAVILFGFMIGLIGLPANLNGTRCHASTSCECDYLFDGDVDGADLAVAIDAVYVDLAALAADFGRIGCPPGLRVSDPNGGEALTAGTWHTIKWSGSDSIDDVDIELSLDGGTTYPVTIARATPNDGIYLWRPVPFHDPAKLSSECRIRIKDSADPDVTQDASDQDFALEPASLMYLETLNAINDALANDPTGVEVDSDGDGLYDNVEIYLGTDPLHWDTDRDGFKDYREIFGDVYDVPVPDEDGDGKITPLDNDDDGNGENDGRTLDSDTDGIPDYLEIYGYEYDPTGSLLYYLWDGDISIDYFKTDPDKMSTDADQYSDSMEVTHVNMDETVKIPGNNPMISAFPNFLVKILEYDVTLNSTITETNGTVHTTGETWNTDTYDLTATTDEWHWEAGAEFSFGFESIFGGGANVSYGESHSVTHTTGTVKSEGGMLSDATEWAMAVCSNPSEAAKIKLHLKVHNVGTCAATGVDLNLNLKIGGKAVATFDQGSPISVLEVNQIYSWVSQDIMLTYNELRALQTGAPVVVEIADITAKVVKKVGDQYVEVGNWQLYLGAANAICAQLFLDRGDGNTTEHLIYAADSERAPVVTLRDALVWAANGEDDPVKGPLVRFYEPGGTLGDPAPLDNWYFSLDTATYNSIAGYSEDPNFNFLDTVLKPDSVVVAKAPPIEETPKIHWAVLSPRKKFVQAYADDYFFPQNMLEVYFVDKDGVEHPMAWDGIQLQYVCAVAETYFKDGSEKIVVRNPMYHTSQSPDDWETVMNAAQMGYVPGFWNPYLVGEYKAADFSARFVDVSGNYAYVTNNTAAVRDIRILDISNPQTPVLVGTCTNCIGGSDSPTDIHVDGNYAYITGYNMGLIVVDCTNKTSPTRKGSVGFYDYDYGFDSNPRSVFVEYPYAYVVAQHAGFNVVGVGNPAAPAVVGKWDPGVHDMWGNTFVLGNYAYIADPREPFAVVNITNKALPIPVGGFSPGTDPYDVVVVGDYAYVAELQAGLEVIDVSVKTTPKSHGILANPGGYTAYYWVKVAGDFAYLSGHYATAVINVKDPAQPSLAGVTTTYKAGNNSSFDMFGDLVCFGSLENGFQIIGFK
jgi:hypothetical protein